MLKVCLALLLALAVYTQTGPVWPDQYSQRFVETYIVGTQKFYNVGETWYDATHSRSRYDRSDGIHAPICNLTLPNVNTRCINLVLQDKRYLVFPERQYGCYCCSAADGCGILKPDWMADGKYEGRETILGESFNKWSKPDGDSMDYYYETVDAARIPRRLDDGPTHIIDWQMNTFNKAAIPDSIFELPSYVKVNEVCGGCK